MASRRWAAWPSPLLEGKFRARRDRPRWPTIHGVENRTMELMLDAPIIPDHGLGGLELRANIWELNNFLSAFGVWEKRAFDLVSPYVAEYRLADGIIALNVDVRNGRIAKMSAFDGYQGYLFGTVKVGMKVSNACRLDSRLYYDEAEGLILCSGIEGVALALVEVDPDPLHVLESNIHSITVFAHEILTISGAEGKW